MPSSASCSISEATKRASACSSSSSRTCTGSPSPTSVQSCFGLRPWLLRDDGVGGRQDRLRRAVVLLQLDDRGAGEVLLEVEDVVDVGSAKAVDRLVVVADDADVAALAGKQLKQPVLRVVGVLVLVDEDPAELPPVALQHVGEQLEHVDRAEQQVVEVERVHLVHAPLVEVVDVGGRLLEEGADLLAVGGGVLKLVLGPRYLAP